MKSRYLYVVTLCALFFCFLIYNQHAQVPVHHSQLNQNQKKSRLLKKENHISNLCEQVLYRWNLDIPVLLIDLDFLKQLENESCKWDEGKPIEIGINEKYKSVEFPLDGPLFKIFYYADDLSKDFLSFDMDEKRIIPREFDTRRIGNVEIPVDMERFSEYWKRSKFLKCLGLDMKRSWLDSTILKGPESAMILARLRDELVRHGMFANLLGGTLLGWYRECTVIPHTRDLDFSVARDSYNPAYLEKLLSGENTDFKLIRSLGELKDSLELTVVEKNARTTKIDIFIMYDGMKDGKLTHSYISGLAGDGTKYRFTFPIYDPWCAAEMHGHIFWVTCSPEEQLTHEYGPDWNLDFPTKSYLWNKSGKNIEIPGKYTKEEMKKYYLEYSV